MPGFKPAVGHSKLSSPATSGFKPAGKGGGGSGKLSGGSWKTIHGHAVYVVDGQIKAGGIPGLTHDNSGAPLGKVSHAPAVGHGTKPKKKRVTGSTESPRPAPVKHAASEGHLVGKAEHAHADRIEKTVAKAIGGKHLSDNEPVDAVAHHEGREHGVEIKSMLKGNKRNITVHDDALLRKVEYAAADSNRTVHTVAVDHRDRYDGGKHAAQHSGHEIYYKRGSGAYALSRMHKVKDHDELRRLIRAKDEDLPEAARGHLPSGNAVDGLRSRAVKAHESRLNKDRARKARLKEAKKNAGNSGNP